MSKKYLLMGLTHFVAVALVLKFLNFILPYSVTCYYTCVTNFLMCVIVAQLTFRFSKGIFLTDRIKPENKAVFITGCDSGFGHGLAKQMDSKGFHVFASCLIPSGPGADDLKKSCSKRLQILELDVRKDDSVKKALEYVKKNLGTCELWALVNNAGILKGLSVEFTHLEEFKETLEINTFGIVRVTKAFLPSLRQSKGRIVNVASLAGRITLPFCAPYTMSKFATVGFTECLGQEMDDWGVRVISVEPEFFRTNIVSIENISRTIETTFSSIDEDIKADYGDKYLTKLKRSLELSSSISSQKVYKVLNAIEMAICLKEPDMIYKPCRNILVEVFWKFIETIPAVMRLFLLKLYWYLIGFPKPKGVGNYL